MNSAEADSTLITFEEIPGTDVKTVHPWRRYFARMFDISLFSVIAMALLSFIGYVLAPERTDEMLVLVAEGWTGKLLGGVAGVLLALPGIAILQSLVGTPGKWLFGIKVRSAAGQRLGMANSFHREILVASKGMAFGIPIASAILMIVSYTRLTDHRETSWDKQLGTRVTYAPMSVVGYIKAGVGGCLVIALMLYEALLSIMPSVG